jgi:hypothetical protein
MKTGDVLSYSWGYDQTNVEFFEVMKATEKSVWLKPIAASPGVMSASAMSGYVMPSLDRTPADHCSVKLNGPKRIVKGTYGAFVSMPHGIAKVWDGKPCHTSWYA